MGRGRPVNEKVWYPGAGHDAGDEGMQRLDGYNDLDVGESRRRHRTR
jgi:hypothetical protein